jgi:DNA-binding NtrC family response regulator
MQSLMHHEWKGEIRELENIIERAVIFSSHQYITVNDLPDFFHAGSTLEMPTNDVSLEGAMNNLERQYILAELRKYNFNKEQTAEALKISLPTLYRRIKDLQIPQS